MSILLDTCDTPPVVDLNFKYSKDSIFFRPPAKVVGAVPLMCGQAMQPTRSTSIR